MQFEEALAQLEKAKQYWTHKASSEGADRARMSRIKLQIFEIGNYNEAAYLLEKWERNGVKTDSELTYNIRLLRVFLESQSGSRQSALENWLKLTKDGKLQRLPRVLIRVLATGLALNFGTETTVKEFTAALKKVKPASARLPLLEAFQYAELPFKPNSSAARRSVKKLLDIESEGRDFIPHALLRADALAFFGETGSAKKLLDRAEREALRQKNSFVYRNILLAQDRLSAPASEKQNIFASGFLSDFEMYPNLCAAACIEQAARFLKQSDIQSCRESLLSAQERLPKSGLTNQLEARLYELYGEAAQLEDNREAAVGNFNRALSIYEKLGNRPAVERLQQLLPLVKQPVFQPEEGYTVQINATAKTLTVESVVPGEPWQNEEKYNLTGEEPFLRATAAETRDISSFYDFSKRLMGNRLEIETRVGEILFSGAIAERLKMRNGSQADFRLDSLSPSLSKIPWELARFDNRRVVSLFRNFYRSSAFLSSDVEKIKWLQIGLRNLVDSNLFADGVFGLQTRDALKSLKKKFKLAENFFGAALNASFSKLLKSEKDNRNTKVLLVRPKHEQQIRSQRSADSAGSPIDWHYQNASFRLETLWASDINFLRDAVEQFQPDIVHIQSLFQLTPNTGQIYLDFGYGVTRYDETSQFSSSVGEREILHTSPAVINDALGLLPDPKLRPLVILDAICPPGMTEIIHQLLYRNTFAAELSQLGNTSGIIGMGLSVNRELQATVTEKLISGLANTESFGAVVNSMKRLSTSEDLEEIIPTSGIALFTNEPSMTILSDEKNI